MVNIRIPRYFDGCDLSTRRCTISYNNALKERGVYTVRKMQVADDSLLLSWYISNHVTKKSGKIHFVVQFSKDVDERGMPYSWSTLPAELNVLPGLDDNIAINESDISLYRSLLLQIQATDKRVADLMQQIGEIMKTPIDFDLLNSKVLSLQSSIDSVKESVAYIENETTIEEGI